MNLINKKELKDSLGQLKGWAYKDGFLKKEFFFNSYMDSIIFVNRMARKAEELNHHPDLKIGYCKIEVTMTSHDLGGVTDTCLQMAEIVEAILSESF